MRACFALMLLSLVCICLQESKAAPFIDSIRILPAQPTENDIVKIAVYAATPSTGKRLSIYPVISPGKIDIYACYNSNNTLAAIGFLRTQ